MINLRVVMEVFYIAGVAIIILMFAAIFMAQANASKTKMQHDLAKAELERAKSEREQTQAETALAIEKHEVVAANERALILTRARDDALTQILSADLASKNEIIAKIEERGGLHVDFGDGNNDNDKGVPCISWKWSPFENAILKFYRNEGTILEDIDAVMKKSNLVHVEQYAAEGSYHDREAKQKRTYNYYAFIETRRTGVRAEQITLDLPVEVRTGKIIDEHGNDITEFKTVQPQHYEEPFYHGFRYRRLTVDPYLNKQAKRRESIDLRREDIELAEEEKELEKMEREIGLRGGTFDAEHIQNLIAEAKRMTDRVGAIEKAEGMLDEMDDVDERQRDIILQMIRKNMYH